MKSLLQTLLFFLLIMQISFAQSPDTVWTKIFSTSGNDYGEYVEQTNDGGFIIVGTTDSSVVRMSGLLKQILPAILFGLKPTEPIITITLPAFIRQVMAVI